jgi:3-hydroxybutyrate dehydrogenase
MRLKDKVAIVTGAASGIGEHIARTFAQAGASVAVTDLDGAGARAVAKSIVAGGARAIGLRVDVTSEQGVERAVARVLEAFGRIDILIANAGIQVISSIDKLAYSDWKRLLAVHLDGAFLTTRAVLGPMYGQRSGSIVYMGSVHSKEASMLKAPYVAAKHGLIGLAKVVAKEGAAHGVRANVICPGFVRTPLVERQIPEQARALGLSEAQVIRAVMLRETVDGEFTTTQDVAEVALFFASFESNALTGQSLVVSHGWFMQ